MNYYNLQEQSPLFDTEDDSDVESTVRVKALQCAREVVGHGYIY